MKSLRSVSYPMRRQIGFAPCRCNLLGQPEDTLDWSFEQAREHEGKAQTRLEAAGLDRVDGLARYTGELGKTLLGQAKLASKIADLVGHSHLRVAAVQKKVLAIANTKSGANGSIGGARAAALAIPHTIRIATVTDAPQP